MKKSDIKKILKHEIESHIPKSPPKIDFPFVVSEKPKRTSYFKKNMKLTFVSVLSLATIILMIAFWGGTNTPPTPSNKLLASDQEVLSFSAISTVALISSLGTNEPMNFQGLSTVQEPPIVTYVMPYLRSVEQLLLSDQGLNVISGSSDLPEYSFFTQFETRDLLGQVTSYVMHYNLTLVDQDDDESEYDLMGVLFYDDQTYSVSGERKIEDDEEIVKFKAFASTNSYVESIYKIEEDKQVFEFKVVKNNLLISESRFKIEYDGNETKVKLQFKEGRNEGEFEFEYYQENGINWIRIEFETEIDGTEISGRMTVQQIIDPLTQQIRYRIVIDPDDDDSYEFEVEKDDDTEEEDPSEPEPSEESDVPSEPDETEEDDDDEANEED